MRLNIRTAIIIACAGIVGIASFSGTRTGACGTGHYLLTRLIGGTLVRVVDTMHPLRNGEPYSLAAAVLLNVAMFLVPAFVLRAFVTGNRYFVLLLLWFGLFTASYFFFFPTTVCP